MRGSSAKNAKPHGIRTSCVRVPRCSPLLSGADHARGRVMRRTCTTLFRMILLALCLGGCRGDAAPARPVSTPRVVTAPPQHVDSRLGPVALTEIATGFDHPWALAFLPDGAMLVTERAGRLRVIRDGQVSGPLRGLPDIFVDGHAGLLDVAISPKFTRDRLVN